MLNGIHRPDIKTVIARLLHLVKEGIGIFLNFRNQNCRLIVMRNIEILYVKRGRLRLRRATGSDYSVWIPAQADGFGTGVGNGCS